MADSALGWAVRLANRRNIPVAVFFPMSASMFSLFLNFHLLQHNGDFPVVLTERGNERVEYLPGLSPTRLVDLLGPTGGTYDFFLQTILDAFSLLPKAQYLILSTLYELELQAVDAIRAALSMPVFTVGGALQLGADNAADQEDYLRWLDQQPEGSVLYVSMGSHLSVSAGQMDEILSGLLESGVRFMLVARTEPAAQLRNGGCGERGLVVRWCDQPRVLSHGSVGGFWSHCGWNSVKEGVRAGVPFLTFPLMADQFLNSKLIVEDWRVGERVREDIIVNDGNALVTRHEIATKVKRFMDREEAKSMEMRARAKELQKTVRNGVSEGDMSSFAKDILKHVQ
ncbi:PREDICTED: UDP-glycosyltransferase 87A1-like [Tarenaya hassleriana]|uniref:UDP-glycosyltransferase 87A1-like n=1 Tax=Tarenaya hassleriana TaxID=28532 RepID=UPI0008FD43C5|nr:PREDICTED: UDP-glycosyltransferase 87A1-like [Tarenaya hassleriana]